MVIAYRRTREGPARIQRWRWPIGGFNVFAHGANGSRITFVVRAIKYWWKKKRGEKKKSGIYDFSGAPSEKREENDIHAGDGSWSAAVRFGGGAKGPQYFKPSIPPPAQPRCPMVIRYFFPNVHANTPFTYPLPIATKFTLCLGMKIRVVATRPFGVTFMRNWVIRWKQLSVLKRKRRCSRHRSFQWNAAGQYPNRFSKDNF